MATCFSILWDVQPRCLSSLFNLPRSAILKALVDAKPLRRTISSNEATFSMARSSIGFKPSSSARSSPFRSCRCKRRSNCDSCRRFRGDSWLIPGTADATAVTSKSDASVLVDNFTIQPPMQAIMLLVLLVYAVKICENKVFFTIFYCSIPIARAATSTTVITDTSAWIIINNFAL